MVGAMRIVGVHWGEMKEAQLSELVGSVPSFGRTALVAREVNRDGGRASTIATVLSRRLSRIGQAESKSTVIRAFPSRRTMSMDRW